MGKVSLGRGEKDGKQNPPKLPPMQTLKPLAEIVPMAETPVNSSKLPLKKYVSPLSLTWTRKTPVEDTNKVISPSKTKDSKESPETVTSNCQDAAAVSTSSSSQVTPTAEDKPEKHLGSCEPAEHENLESSFKISEGAFNTSRICVASTPLSSNARSSDDCKLDAGENKQEKDVYFIPLGNVEANISRKKNRKRNKNNQNSSIDLTAGVSKEKIKKVSSRVIETIDLDLTNDSVSRDVELVAIKKVSNKPVDFVDLSATLDETRSAPSGNDTIIVIDDDNPYVPNTSRNSGKTASKTLLSSKKLKKLRESNQSRLFKIQPHPGLIKKRERQRRKKPKHERRALSKAEDDVCFLGTGISLRPPIPIAGNAAARPVANFPSSSAGSATETGIPSQPSIYGSNFDNPNSDLPRTGLRPIVIDGSNVAMGHGKTEKVFSSKGIEICVNYFLKRGHKVYCFVPLYRKSDPLTKDRQILDALEEQGHLIFTPSRYVGSNAIVPYDDRYIVQIAAELGGVIISRDNFRDLMAENPIFKEVILERTLMFTWVGDIIMFPNDPFGRRNVSLDRMLRF